MAATLVRTVAVYILVVFGIRIMGKRQIGELQPGELVITIMISECASFPIQDLSRPFINSIISVFTLIILEIALSLVTRRYPKLRRCVEGSPKVVILQGKILTDTMKTLRLSTDDLVNALRQQGFFDINDISVAVVETNGKLSVLPRAEKQTATAEMVKPEKYDNEKMPCVVIDEGHIRDKSLGMIGVSRGFVDGVLKSRGLKLADVYLMTADSDKNVFIAEFSKGDEKH